jgi:FKBP-type peptidyl-prolyl cis-trans isomerase FkpA
MNMRYIYPLLLLAFILTACKKDDTTEQADQDASAINEYLIENGLSATQHSSGLYYDITKEGTGGHPNLSHTVVVDYKGYLLDGTVFDQSTNAVELQLNALITGFQIAVSLLKPGGEGTFYIPSQLGYGNQQVGDIPPNSILIFEIELVEYF